MHLDTEGAEVNLAPFSDPVFVPNYGRPALASVNATATASVEYSWPDHPSHSQLSPVFGESSVGCRQAINALNC